MEDNSLIRVMQSLDLDYSKAILSTKHFEQTIQSLNKQLAGMKGIAMQSAKDINNTFSAQLGNTIGGKTIVDQYGNAFKTVQMEATKSTKSTASGFVSATTAAKQHGKAIQDVAKDYNVMGSEMQRRMSWFLSGGLFYGALKGAKEAIQTISEVEMGMVEISRVMEDSTFVFKDYRDELLQLGVDYGQSFDTVQDIALRWAQAGYGVKDSLDNTKYSLLALNTAELDASNATESLIGIMSQWQLTSADMPLLLDKINKTADDFTVTSQDLVDGLLRSSGAARIMNLSIDETISLLTVMREASGRTGREVGNALNSILSYIQRPKSIDTLGDMGINMFADTAKTQFRNVMEIFQDIASKWDTASSSIKDGFIESADDANLFSEELATALGMQEEWNDLQTRDISQASAGVYRRNYFIGMIERLSKAQEVLNGMTDAAGYSQTENARTMEALEKKYQSLKTSAEQLAIALGDAGLLDVLKGIVDTGANVTSSIAKMDDEGKALLATALELIAAIVVIKGASGLFTTKNLLFGATAMLPGWTKLLAIIPGVIGAIALYKNNLDSASSSVDDINSKQDKLIQNYESQLKTIKDNENGMLSQAKTAELLANKIDLLSKKESLNISEKEQMKSVVDQLNGIFPNLTLAIDEQTGKVIGNTTAIYDNIEALKKQAIEQAYQAKMQATATEYVNQEVLLGQTKSDLESAKGQINSLSGEMAQAYENAEAEIAEAREKAESQKWGERSLTIKINDIKKKYGVTDANIGINKSHDNVNSLEKIVTEQEKRMQELDAELNDWVNKSLETTSNISSNSYTPSTGEVKPDKSKTKAYKNDALNEALKVLDYKKYINELTTEDEIKTLNQIKANHVNTADELMDINKRIYSAEKSLLDEQLKTKQDTLNISKNWIAEETQYGKLANEDLIASYERVKNKQIDNIEAVKYANKGLFDTYKDMLAEEQQAIKDAYDERMDRIDEEAKAKKQSLEDEKTAIKEQLDLLDRKDNQRSHEQTLSDLQKDLEYWQVRTSEEARKKVIEIEKQIYEEKYKYNLEQQKQSLNDKIDNLDDEIDEVEKTANEEKAKWEKSYKLTEKAFDKHSSNIIALAGAMSKEAYRQWVDNYLTPLQNALSSGDFDSFNSISGGLSGSVNGLNGNSKANYVLVNKDGTSNANVGDIVVTGGGLFKKNADGTSSKVGDLSGGNTSDYNKVIEEYNKLPKFHEGGKAYSDGLAVLKKDELIFPPDLSLKMDGLLSFLKGNNTYQSNSTSNAYDNRKEVRIDKLVNIENNCMEDEVDSDMFARELGRIVNSII